MKKIITILAIVVTVGFIGTHAVNAHWYQSNYGGMHHWGPYNTNYEENNVDRTKFYTETVDLRKAIATKQIELNTLLYDKNSNKETIKSLESEIFDLNEELNKKAVNAGIGNGHWGHMMNYGMMNYGFGNCWN